MNIIIEGPDGAGKTTLINELRPHVRGCSIPTKLELKDGPPKNLQAFQSRLQAFNNFFFRRLAMVDRETVMFDRCPYISEPIYGCLFREKTYISPNQMNEFLFRCLSDTLIIFVLPPKEEYMERRLSGKKEWKSKEHMEQVLENRSKVYDAYVDIHEKLSNSDVIYLPYDGDKTMMPLMLSIISKLQAKYQFSRIAQG